jgi:hypothetical protein
MTMSTKTQDRLVALLERHEDIVLAALDGYRAEIEKSRDECTRAAKECQEGYDRVKDDPAARAAQDRTGITTMGLYHLARRFTEGAGKHAENLAALDEISQALSPDEDPDNDHE